MRQQIYNNMSNSSNFINATVIASSAFSIILANTERTISINEFVRRNQPVFVLQSQRQIINSNFKHIFTVPSKSPNKNDREPSTIPTDTFMNVGTVKESEIGSYGDNVSVKTRSERHSLKVSKYSSNKSSKNQKPSKQSAKKEILGKFQSLWAEYADNEEFQCDRLRQQKIHEELLKLSSQPKERQKAVCHLAKGEQVVFDYDGNPSKRKETVSKYVNSSVISGGATKEVTSPKPKNARSQHHNSMSQQSEITPTKSTDRSRKLKESQQIQREIAFDYSNKKEEILKSLQIKNPGIRITVDGETAKVDKQIMENNCSKSKITQKVKTLPMKKLDVNYNPRFKTEVLPESSQIRDLPSTKRPSQWAGVRSGTEASSYYSKIDKISVQNIFLQKLVLPNEDDVEDKYIELPSHRKRRVKTNLQSQSPSTDLQGMRIKEKLMRMTKDGEKLPKIISQHNQVQIEILREMRKKILM